MSTGPQFHFDYEFEYGLVQSVAAGVRRVVARNPSAFTFRGTGTYIVGRGAGRGHRPWTTYRRPCRCHSRRTSR